MGVKRTRGRFQTRNVLTPLPFRHGPPERFFEWQVFCHLDKVARASRNASRTNHEWRNRMSPKAPSETLIREDNSPDRRAVLAGLSVAAAATAIAATPTAADAQPAVATDTFWNQRYEAMKGNVKLQLYRRRLKAPVAGQ